MFPIYDAPMKAGSYNRIITSRAMARSFKKDPDKNELQLRLYPEGGEMIKGVPCRVAFEAAYTSGEYVDGTVSIQEGKKTRKLAHTDNRGRGVFTFTPTDSKSSEFLFTATDKNKKGTAKASIKNISADGVVLSVEQSDSLWNICVTKAGELKSDTLGITIMHDARVRAMYELTDSVTRIVLNNDDLETGVNQGNDEGQIGFLRDLRRMNVAITRARMKLIILGSVGTLTKHPFYKRLYEYISSLTAYEEKD